MDVGFYGLDPTSFFTGVRHFNFCWLYASLQLAFIGWILPDTPPEQERMILPDSMLPTLFCISSNTEITFWGVPPSLLCQWEAGWKKKGLIQCSLFPWSLFWCFSTFLILCWCCDFICIRWEFWNEYDWHSELPWSNCLSILEPLIVSSWCFWLKFRLNMMFSSFPPCSTYFYRLSFLLLYRVVRL